MSDHPYRSSTCSWSGRPLGSWKCTSHSRLNHVIEEPSQIARPISTLERGDWEHLVDGIIRHAKANDFALRDECDEQGYVSHTLHTVTMRELVHAQNAGTLERVSCVNRCTLNLLDVQLFMII